MFSAAGTVLAHCAVMTRGEKIVIPIVHRSGRMTVRNVRAQTVRNVRAQTVIAVNVSSAPMGELGACNREW